MRLTKHGENTHTYLIVFASSFLVLLLDGPTPGSMNRLFSDLFRKFEGVILEVFATIWGCLGDIFGGQSE